MNTPPHAQPSLVAVLGRIVWMMLGPLALVVTTGMIATRGGGWMTGADIAFFAILGAMFLGRGLEFLSGTPQTAEGQPATPAHLRNYLVYGTVLGVAAYVVANLVGNGMPT